MHVKRLGIGKFWPVARKGTKYVALSSHNKNKSMPLVVVVRDVLKLSRTKKELRKAINEKQIKVNGKEVREVNYPIGLFDVLSVLDKNYRAKIGENKKMAFEEIKGEEVNKKVIKVIGKKVLSGKKAQLNLADGRNLLYDKEVRVGDSVEFNFKDNKISKVIKMEKGSNGFVTRGKHTGVFGKINDITEIGGKKIAIIGNGEKVNVWVKSIIAME